MPVCIPFSIQILSLRVVIGTTGAAHLLLDWLQVKLAQIGVGALPCKVLEIEDDGLIKVKPDNKFYSKKLAVINWNEGLFFQCASRLMMWINDLTYRYNLL